MRRALMVAGLLSVCALARAQAAEPLGTWSTEGAKAQVRIAKCGSGLCGAIVALKEPNDPATGKPKTDISNADASKRNRPMIGVQIVLGMKPRGANKWDGRVYNAEDGKTYSGNITLQNANTLQLQGCVMGGMVCKSQTWTRVN